LPEERSVRKVVFDTLTERGENVHNLIEDKQAHNPGMSYDKASREVVAEAMTDILPDANFVQELAENHKTIFQKLLDQLKEFVANLRNYFNSIGRNPSREANALKEQVGDTIKYLDNIVNLFDKVAVQAVEKFQQTAAAEEVALDNAGNGDVQYQNRNNLNPNPDALKVSPAEERETFERIRQDQMRRYMREHNGEIPSVWCSFGTSYFYVYSNFSFLEYRTYSKMLITGNEEIIDAISEGVIDGRITSRESYRSVLKLARSARQRSRRTGSNDTEGRQGRRDAGLVGDQRGSDRAGSNPSSNSNYAAESSEGTQSQQRTDTLTDRDILGIAEKDGLMEALTAGQKYALQTFNQKNEKVGELLKQKEQQEKTLQHLQKTEPKNTQEIAKAKNRIRTLDGQLFRESAKLREYEQTETIKAVLKTVKPIIIENYRVILAKVFPYFFPYDHNVSGALVVDNGLKRCFMVQNRLQK
jgi:hypothetical protein